MPCVAVKRRTTRGPYIFRYEALPLTVFARTPAAVLNRSRFEPGAFGSRFETRVEGRFAAANAATRARACARARLQGEAQAQALAQGQQGEAGGGGARSFLLPG